MAPTQQEEAACRNLQAWLDWVPVPEVASFHNFVEGMASCQGVVLPEDWDTPNPLPTVPTNEEVRVPTKRRRSRRSVGPATKPSTPAPAAKEKHPLALVDQPTSSSTPASGEKTPPPVSEKKYRQDGDDGPSSVSPRGTRKGEVTTTDPMDRSPEGLATAQAKAAAWIPVQAAAGFDNFVDGLAASQHDPHPEASEPEQKTSTPSPKTVPVCTGFSVSGKKTPPVKATVPTPDPVPVPVALTLNPDPALFVLAPPPFVRSKNDGMEKIESQGEAVQPDPPKSKSAKVKLPEPEASKRVQIPENPVLLKDKVPPVESVASTSKASNGPVDPFKEPVAGPSRMGRIPKSRPPVDGQTEPTPASKAKSLFATISKDTNQKINCPTCKKEKRMNGSSPFCSSECMLSQITSQAIISAAKAKQAGSSAKRPASQSNPPASVTKKLLSAAMKPVAVRKHSVISAKKSVPAPKPLLPKPSVSLPSNSKSIMKRSVAGTCTPAAKAGSHMPAISVLRTSYAPPSSARRMVRVEPPQNQNRKPGKRHKPRYYEVGAASAVQEFFPLSSEKRKNQAANSSMQSIPGPSTPKPAPIPAKIRGSRVMEPFIKGSPEGSHIRESLDEAMSRLSIERRNSAEERDKEERRQEYLALDPDTQQLVLETELKCVALKRRQIEAHQYVIEKLHIVNQAYRRQMSDSDIERLLRTRRRKIRFNEQVDSKVFTRGQFEEHGNLHPPRKAFRRISPADPDLFPQGFEEENKKKKK